MLAIATGLASCRKLFAILRSLFFTATYTKAEDENNPPRATPTDGCLDYALQLRGLCLLMEHLDDHKKELWPSLS